MVRKRKKSDDIVNFRRRVMRVIKAEEKKLGLGPANIGDAARREYVEYLKRELNKTYIGRKKGNSRDLAYQRANKVIENLKQELPTARQGKSRTVAIRNRIFVREMQMASRRIPTSLGRAGKEKTHIFWRATQPIWDRPDVSPSNRLNAIMRRYGETDLQRLFARVMEEQSDAVKLAESSYAQRVNTNGMVDDLQPESSPPAYMAAVVVQAMRS